ncbi:MAG: acyl-CoA thioesterase [Proteobacteria bacterium]|nr:acyl-CoA thioesterase [Pseudomonadota bacterium]
MIETYRGVVYPDQLDHMDHMNVKWYTAKFDEATWHLFSAIGITSEYMREQNKGMAALEQHTLYKAEARAGDLLLVKSRVLEIRGKIVKFLHIMLNAETLLETARTELVAAQIDRETRRSCPLPDVVIDSCEELFELSNS